ncbi:MAG: hypothetical protein ACYTEQ_25615 [Planctomycetota bacterium]|jgi:YD repeat-containing protein
MDDLGNRDMVSMRDGNDVNYVIDYLTNRYSKVGDANITYDQAGSLATDKDGYGYEYDYENRIVEINDVNGTTVAEFAYDALGRRIEKKDSIAGTTTHYYYNDKWQVLCEYIGGAGRAFVYGNYIDEVLAMNLGLFVFYAHDHLYSPVALVYTGGAVLERYEYDAYGDCHVLEPKLCRRSTMPAPG